MPPANNPLMPATPDHERTRANGSARATAGRGARGNASGVHALPVGTRLRDYEITGVLSEASFAIVYIAHDHSLRRRVAIKEYMPVSMAKRAAAASFVGVRSDQSADTYRAGLKSFLNEARLLARFDHPSLVKVYRFWEENGTAYMVMPYYEGPDLSHALAELGHVPTEAELRTWLRPILDAVTVMHEAGFYHHHIGPDNIRLTELGPVLLDFAAARRVVEGETHTLAMSLKPGYAAIEQYGDGAPGTQGAWTDLYALAAVLYTAITGVAPMPAPERLARDGVLKLRDAAASLYSDSFLHAIDAALSLQADARPRDHAQFRNLMHDIEAPNEAIALSALRDLMLEPFVVDTTRGPDEITVPNGHASNIAARRSLPGAFNDAPSTMLPGGLSSGARHSRPGVLDSAGRHSRPDELGGSSRPGELGASGSRSRPGALGRPSSSKPGALDSMPAGSRAHGATHTAAGGKPAQKTLSPRAARIAAAHERSGEPSEVNPDVDFSASLEFRPFFERFGIAAKAGIAILSLALIGLAVWLAKSDVEGNAEAPVLAIPQATISPPPVAAPATPARPPGTAMAPLPPPDAVARTAVPEATGARPGTAPAADSPQPISESSRQARCVEILQKVSLEPMTPADAAFYKKECQR